MKTRTFFAVFTLAIIGATAAYADKLMDEADISGDGAVSLDEFRSAHGARLEERFAKMDADGNGMLTADEISAAKEARRGDKRGKRGDRRRGKRGPEAMIERLDADGNGTVSFTELEGKRFSPDLTTFQVADADGSGGLDAAEFDAMMKARRAERRARDESNED